MGIEPCAGSSRRQWLWFVAIWAAGVMAFGGVVLVLKLAMGAVLT